jgi:hypothetical protein
VLLLRIFILAVLLLIFVQDLRSRSVYWVLFPLLAALFVASGLWEHRSWTDLLQPAMFNCMFLAVQLLLVSAYFSLKNSKWINIFAGLLGWGDVLLLLSMAFYFSVLNFLCVYVASLILALLLWLSWQRVAGKKDKQLPLAGLQAMIFSVFLTADWYSLHLRLTDDTWLLNLLHR